MKLNRHIRFFVIVLIVAGILVFTALNSRNNETPQVITTTSVLSSIVDDIAGDHIKTASLVPAGSCPGHFDIKIAHLRLIEQSGILLAHGFEPYLPEIKQSIKNSSFDPIFIQLERSWLTKNGMSSLYRQVAENLIKAFPDYEQSVSAELERASAEIGRMHDNVRSVTEKIYAEQVAVIANDHLRGFLEYIGFDVAATYDRREDLSPVKIKNLMKAGEEKGVRIVIDNMQAGEDTGKVFAEELGIAHVAVSNFPAVLPDGETLYATLLLNLERITKELK